ARFRRQHACAEVDRGSGTRSRARTRDADRLDAAVRGYRMARARFSEGAVRAAPGLRSRTVDGGSARSRGVVPASARSSPPRNGLRTRVAYLSPVAHALLRAASTFLSTPVCGPESSN